MQAKCPQCGSTFQTERTGAQFCPNCGQQVNVADTSGAAPAGAPPPAAPAARGPTPWERRGELGLVQAFWQTWKGLLVETDGFWARLDPHGKMSDALFYGWIIAVVQAIIALPFQSLIAGQLFNALGPLKQAGLDLPAEQVRMMHLLLTGPALYGRLAAGALLYPVGLVISSGLIHLFALMFGAAKNGFNATFRVVAYASGPLVLAGIPYLGGLVGLYVLVLQIWGLSKAQETTGGRAAGAVLGFPVLACCCACIGLFVTIAAVAGHHQ